jgi:hypothetical protein
MRGHRHVSMTCTRQKGSSAKDGKPILAIDGGPVPWHFQTFSRRLTNKKRYEFLRARCHGFGVKGSRLMGAAVWLMGGLEVSEGCDGWMAIVGHAKR